jgi:biotin transport system substrate-specific component
MSCGLAIIFAGGVLWLTRFVQPAAALAAGLYPFIVEDVVKLLVAGAVMPALWFLARRT